MAPAIELRQLKKSYGRRAILDIAEAAFAQGEITALVGPNGCGKTTLLECMNGLTKPDSGEILFFGEPLSRDARRRMTLVFQSPYLFNTTVENNVSYGLRFSNREAEGTVAKALESVGLNGFEKRRARSLSGGEAKRVAVARALAVAPEVLLLDEPTANVDTENTEIIEAAIRQLRTERGATVIIATHDRDQAVRLADRILLIDNGSLSPFHPDNHYTAELIAEGGEMVLLIGDGLRAVASTGKAPGRVSCVIPPSEIIVSAAPVDSSARNCWSGPVTGISKDGDRIRLVVDTGVPVEATITRASFEKLNPTIGTKLYLTFKASSILVF